MIYTEEYIIAKTVNEAIEAYTKNTDAAYIAGGTDIMVNRYQENETSKCLIDISFIEELKGINPVGNYLRIGPLEKLEDLGKNKDLQSSFPFLIEAALAVGSPLIRKTATIGGNILCENRCLFYNQSEWWRKAVGYCLKCNGDICIATGGKNACFSEMVSDTAPALIALDAEVEFINQKETKRFKLTDLYSGDGVQPLTIDKSFLLTGIYIPLNRKFKGVFKKLRIRESLDFTSLSSAVSIDENNQIIIALSGVDPKPVVVYGKLSDDKEKLIKTAIKQARAVDNDMLSRKYRKEMINVFINKSFEELNIKL
ncbi:MAG: xanthine dehydrogenase family protein subunit M [Vicingaceae bacterium]